MATKRRKPVKKGKKLRAGKLQRKTTPLMRLSRAGGADISEA